MLRMSTHGEHGQRSGRPGPWHPAGRSRSQSEQDGGASFGALDQSLAQLEAKLSALQSRLPDAHRNPAPPRSSPQAPPAREVAQEPTVSADDPFARLARSLPLREQPAATPAPVAAAPAVATAPVAPAASPEPTETEGRFTGAVAREIGRMRADMNGDMHKRFEELGSEIAALRTAVASDSTPAKLEAEFDRVYDGLEAVATALDKRGDETTKKEFEHLRREVSKLAAEDTLHAVGRGQDELARRLAQHQASVDPEIATIRGQLDELSLKIDSGETTGLKALERRIAGIAQSIEAVRAQTGEGPDLTAVEARLDDIARAVIAASQTPAPIDTAPFERIEARIAGQQRRLDERDKRRDADYADAIGGIAKRLEFVGEAQEKTVEATSRLASDLTDRFAAMTADGALTRDALAEDLTPRFAQIANHVDGVNGRVDDWGKRLDGWGQRLTDEARRPREAEISMFKALAGRLDAVSDRLSELPDAATDDQNWAALEARMAAVMQKLDRVPTDTLDTGALDELRAQLTSIAWKLEQPQGQSEGHEAVTGRIDALAETMRAAPTDVTEEAIERISRTVTGELEERISDRFDGQLSARLSDLTEVLHRSTAPLADLGPRMDALEESMGDAQVTLVETARSAAEDVVKAMLEQGQQMAPGEAEAVNALDEDVKKLEELTRDTDERNTKTFDAVHETLLKIVDRLDTLDGMVAKATRGPDPAVIAATHAALMQQQAPQQPTASLMDRLRGRGAAPEAAAVVAAPTLSDSTLAEPAFAEPTVTPAFDGGSGSDFDAPHDPAAFDGLDPDTPLEPDTNEPRFEDAPAGEFDPAAIADDVRAGENPDDPAADFLAVARRKAQAVAAEAAFDGEAEIKPAKGKASGGKGKAKRAGKARLAGDKAADKGGKADGAGGSALARYRKPMLLAAAVAIAAALVLPSIVSTIGGVMGDAPIMAEMAEETNAPETFGEVAPLAPVAAEMVADAEEPFAEGAMAEGTMEVPAEDVIEEPVETAGVETTTFTVPVQPVEGTDPTTTRSIDPVAPTPDVTDAVSGPVEGLTFGASDGPAPLVAAAEGGDARALHEIAGRADDAGRALTLYRAAAERGLAPAQYRLGQAFEKGRGTPVDYAKAKQWYARAAEAGNTSAMHNLAVLYAMGAQAEADPVLAGQWFTRAANHGVKDSQYNLGILHAQGTGVAEDLTESYKWFDAAAKSGDPEAGGKRDEVAGAMAPGELETAKIKAGAFRAQAPDVAANRVAVPETWRAAPALDPADMKRAVRNVQAILNKNGFDAGTADGVMGKKTRTAILAFQEAAGLPKTGQIDDALVQALLERNT